MGKIKKKLLIHTTEMLKELTRARFSDFIIEQFDAYCLGYSVRKKDIKGALKYLKNNFIGNIPE